MTAKTSLERLQAMRQRREALGLARLDLYAHRADHAAIRAVAARLLRARSRVDRQK